MDFSGKVVALVGVGDAAIFGGNYVEALKHLYDAVQPKGAKIVGFTSTDGYDFEASEAVIDGEDVYKRQEQYLSSVLYMLFSQLFLVELVVFLLSFLQLLLLQNYIPFQKDVYKRQSLCSILFSKCNS